MGDDNNIFLFLFILAPTHGLWDLISPARDQTQAPWASLVVQWLRIHLPIQGTWVRALVWKDPTCRGATKSMSHNY